MSVFAYVVNLADNNVSVIDTSTNTVVATIPVDPSPTIPRFIAITPDGRFAYVTNYANILSVIDTSINALVDTIILPVGNFSEDIRITPNGNFAYFANSGLDNVSVLNTATNTIVANVPVGNSPYGIAITPNGSFVYVTNTGSDNVSVINTNTNTVVATIPVGDAPVGIAITPNGNFAYVANQGQSVAANTVSVIDTRTNTVVDTITVGLGPTAVAITPDGNFVYVTNAGSFSVSVIDTGTNSVVATIPVGRFPFGIAITPDGNFAYVANSGDDYVSVIDTNTNTVVDTVTVGDGPLGIAFANIGQQQVNLSISLTKSDSPDPVKLGENLTYTIKVTNKGPDTASEVVLTDTLPQEVDFISAISNGGSCSESNGVVTCVLGTMDVNETATIIITVKPTSTGTICNKVVVSANGLDSNSCNNMAFQCTTVLETVCLHAKRIFGSCSFEEQKQKIFRLPCINNNEDLQCQITETKCEVLDVNKIGSHQDLVDVKLRVTVYISFKNHGLNNNEFKGAVSFDKSIILNSTEGADICCSASATCKCVHLDDITTKQHGHMFFKKVCCRVKVTGAVRSEKFVQIEVPFLGNCRPGPCDHDCDCC